MAEWYVFQHDSAPLGPWTTERVAEAILSGEFEPGTWVAPPGGARWLRALDIPVIAKLIDGMPTRPRREGTLSIVPGTLAKDAGGEPAYGSTVMMVNDDEISLIEAAALEAALNETTVPGEPLPEASPTQPGLPPSPGPAKKG